MLDRPAPPRTAPPWMLAAASYLARYSVSLRVLFTWCADHGLDPLEARRVHLEWLVRYLKQERRCIPAASRTT